MSSSPSNLSLNGPFGGHGVPSSAEVVETTEMESSLIEQIADNLARGHPSVAARVFLRGRALGLIPRSTPATSWLTAHLNADAVQPIAEAIASLPAPCCLNGFVPCPQCDSSGTDGAQHCDLCCGLGVQRCDFCDGTGLMQYHDLPEDLIPMIARRRLKIVADAMTALESTTDDAGRDAKKLRVRMLNTVKLLGVIENVVTQLPHLSSEHVNEIHELHRASGQLAGTLKPRRTAALSALGECWRERCQAKVDQSEPACDLAAYFTDLAARPGLARTVLANPFLFVEDVDTRNKAPGDETNTPNASIR